MEKEWRVKQRQRKLRNGKIAGSREPSIYDGGGVLEGEENHWPCREGSTMLEHSWLAVENRKKQQPQ